MNTKQKGNNFERDCSRMLSLWWTNGKRDDAIWRSASSGALTTVGKGRYLAHTGDFAATDGEAELLFKHVIIEAKRGYNRYSVQDLLDVPEKGRAKNPVWEMARKLAKACMEQKKVGFLLWKRDRRDLLVLILRPDVMNTPRLCFDYRLILHFPPNEIVGVVPWYEFCTTVSADRLRSLLMPPAASSALTPLNPAP
jgi:hypothetical protein